MRKLEFIGNISQVRDIEDCIRATRKYTKGIFSKRVDYPLQGDGFPSRSLTEYYEVYPDTELSWDMPAGVALDWLWGDVPHVDVFFKYIYQTNKACVVIYGSQGDLAVLEAGIPGLGEALKRLQGIEETSEQVVGTTDRNRDGSVAHPQPVADQTSHK